MALRGWSQWVVQRLWGMYSRCYDGLLDLAPYRDLLDETVKSVEPDAGRVVADLGCGTGNVLERLVSQNLNPETRFVGVDSSFDMISRARLKLSGDHRVSLVGTDINNWLSGRPDGSVDRITSVNVLYTFDAEDRQRFWTECRRVLSEGGRAVVVTTDREGFWPVVREQYERAGSVRRGLTARLVVVAIMNAVIWLLESKSVFHPVPPETLRMECERAGFKVLDSWRSYGGPEDGVAVTLVLDPVVELSDRGVFPLDLEGVGDLDVSEIPIDLRSMGGSDAESGVTGYTN